MNRILLLSLCLSLLFGCDGSKVSSSGLNYTQYLIEGKLNLPDPVVVRVDSAYYVCPQLGVIHNKEDVLSQGLLLYYSDICDQFYFAEPEEYLFPGWKWVPWAGYLYPHLILEEISSVDDCIIYRFKFQPKFYRLIAIANNPSYDVFIDEAYNFRYDKEYTIAIVPIFTNRQINRIGKNEYLYLKQRGMP